MNVNIVLERKRFQEVFDAHEMDRIEFYSWTEKDRAKMKVNVLPNEEFTDDSCVKNNQA